MTFLTSLLYILSFTALLVFLTRKRFEEVCFLSVLITSYMMYVTAFFYKLAYGYYIGVFLIALFVLYMLYRFLRHKDLKTFISNYFTKGLLIFLILFLFIYLIQINRTFNFWDEYGHWGIMNRECIKYRTFYSPYYTELQIHKDYPPLFVLIELLWACFNRMNYSEGMIYVALASFSMMLLLPIISKISKKDWLKTSAAIISILLLLIYINYSPQASDSAHLLNSIYVDWTLSIFAAYTLYFIHSSESSIINDAIITILLTSLLMMKQIGIAFFALASVYLLYRRLSEKKQLKEIIKCLIIGIIIPALVFYSWKRYIIIQNVALNSQFKIGSVFKTVYGLLINGNVEAWQKIAFGNFLKAIVSRPLFVHPFGISYFPFVLTTAILLLALTGFKRKTIELSVIYVCGSIGYAAMMLLLYVSSFGEIEGPPLASFDRYMIAYLYYGVCLLFYEAFSEYERKYSYAVLLVFLLLTFEYRDLKLLNPSYQSDRLITSEIEINDLLHVNISKDEKILIIQCFDNRDALSYQLRYYQNDNYDILENDYFDQQPSIDEYNELLKKYDYLYVLTVNDDYINEYWKETANEDVCNYALYKINFVNGNLELKLLKIEYL